MRLSFVSAVRFVLGLVAKIASGVKPLDKKYEVSRRLGGPWPKGPFLWFHGASMGECRMLLSLAEALKVDWESCPRILLTTQKAEAVSPLKRLSQGLCEVSIAPADFPGTMKKFIAQVKPVALVLGENELWPGYISSVNAFRGGDSVALVSGRARRRPWWIEESSFGFVAAQTSFDLERLGFNDGAVCGNWKLLSWAREGLKKTEETFCKSDSSRLVDVACISFHREELDSFCKLALNAVNCRKSVVLAPRRLEDVELFREVLLSQKIQIVSWPCVQRSAVSIVDCFGAVPDILKMCRVAIVGGSFHKRLGIHDFWEPLCAGVPAVVGPYSRGAEGTVAELVQSGALVRLDNDSKDFFDCEIPFNAASIQSALQTQREKILNSYEQLLKFLLAAV